jgi:hypothetical protein
MGSLIGQGIVGIVLPVLLALILNGLVLRATAFAESRKWPFIGLIVAVCFAFSYSVLFGGIAFPPREATHWLPFIAVGAVVLGTILQLTSGFGRSIVRLIAALATAWTVLQLQIFGRWPLLISIEWLVAITLILFATSRLIEREGGMRSTPTEILLGMALAAGFGGVALFLGGSAVLGQICITFGLLLGGLTVLTLFLPPTQLDPVIPLIYVLLFGSLLLNGSLFSDLPWPTAGLLWLAPFGVLIGPPARSPGANRNLRLLLRALIVLVIVGLGFVALFLISPPHGNEY